MLTRRMLLAGVAALAICTPCYSWTHGQQFSQPSNASIPVSSLSAGGHTANAFTGFASPATTISGSAPKVINPNPDNDLLVCTTTGPWRDEQIASWTGRGTFFLRLSGSPGAQTALYMTQNNGVTGGDIRIGIVVNFDETKCCDPGCGNGIYLPNYVNTNVAASAEGIAVGYNPSYAGQALTFGCNGFNVYLLYNGQVLWSYTEWRLMNFGRMAIWTHQTFGATDVTATFLPLKSLFSNPALSLFDPRDFGMAQIDAVGSISASSNSLVLTTNAGYTVGQQIIVELGGESGAGARGTVGVGGVWPFNSYATTAALQAATPAQNPTWAYAQDTLLVWAWDGSTWTHRNDGGGTFNQSYYTETIVPQALVAQITAISPDGKTLTLSKSAAVQSTGANVYLDCASSYSLIFENTLADGIPAPNPMTISNPSGRYAFSRIVGGQVRPNCTVTGPSGGSFEWFSPKGVTCVSIGLTNIGVSDAFGSFQNITFQGNFGDNGYGLNIDASGNYQPGPVTCALDHCNGGLIKNCVSTNIFSGAAQLAGLVNGLIDTCSVTLTVGQRAYNGWQIQLADCTGGEMKNCTATGPFILKSFELFATNGGKITNCGGQNCIYSFNSSTSSVVSMTANVTFTANCWFNQLSGAIDEAIFQINQNAFFSGSGGTITCNPGFKCIQQGYIDASDNTLKFIQITPGQTDWTVSGGFPGGAGCSDSLGGYFEAPDYNAGSAEYGAMLCLSDAPRTAISGIRIKGAAIGTPGHGSHFGNISLAGASSSVTNCVADAIQTGPTLSGNQTNLAYCP